MTILSLRGIRKGYVDNCVIWEASVDFSGGIHLIEGCNGSGKTTLLNVAAGVEPPLAGQVLLDGMPTRSFRGRIVFAPATPELFDGISVDYAVRLYMLASGKRPPLDVFATCDPFSLREYSGRKFGDLSLGVKKRVQLHMVLAVDPDVLLLDEPTVGLDAESMVILGKRIASRRPDSVSIVTSHDPGWIGSAGTRRHMLLRGERGSVLTPGFMD